jgi:hypothetical protein
VTVRLTRNNQFCQRAARKTCQTATVAWRWKPDVFRAINFALLKNVRFHNAQRKGASGVIAITAMTQNYLLECVNFAQGKYFKLNGGRLHIDLNVVPGIFSNCGRPSFFISPWRSFHCRPR